MGKQTRQTTKQIVIHNLQPEQGWCPPFKTNRMLRVCDESMIITDANPCTRYPGRMKEKRGERETVLQPEIDGSPFSIPLISFKTHIVKSKFSNAVEDVK